MATYEGEDMKKIAPILNLGEEEHILQSTLRPQEWGRACLNRGMLE